MHKKADRLSLQIVTYPLLELYFSKSWQLSDLKTFALQMTATSNCQQSHILFNEATLRLSTKINLKLRNPLRNASFSLVNFPTS